MPTWRTELVGDVGSENSRLHRGRVRLERALHEPRIRARVLAERKDAIDTCIPGVACEAGELRIVAIKQGGAIALKPGEDFRLGVGDRLE